jgi:hypothetical protein
MKDGTYFQDDVDRLKLDRGHPRYVIQRRKPGPASGSGVVTPSYKGPRGAKRPKPVTRFCRCETAILNRRRCFKCGREVERQSSTKWNGSPAVSTPTKPRRDK